VEQACSQVCPRKAFEVVAFSSCAAVDGIDEPQVAFMLQLTYTSEALSKSQSRSAFLLLGSTRALLGEAQAHSVPRSRRSSLVARRCELAMCGAY
jgi:hypothetical protein